MLPNCVLVYNLLGGAEVLEVSSQHSELHFQHKMTPLLQGQPKEESEMFSCIVQLGGDINAVLFANLLQKLTIEKSS